MQGLQIGDFGTFVFYKKHTDGTIHRRIMQGLEITDIDHHNVWLSGFTDDIYMVKKKDIELFEKTNKPLDKLS